MFTSLWCVQNQRSDAFDLQELYQALPGKQRLRLCEGVDAQARTSPALGLEAAHDPLCILLAVSVSQALSLQMGRVLRALGVFCACAYIAPGPWQQDCTAATATPVRLWCASPNTAVSECR